VTALATKWNMEIKSQFCIRGWRTFDGFKKLSHMIWLPKRIRRVIGHKIIARCRRLLFRLHLPMRL
jgi:hypothetical protein